MRVRNAGETLSDLVRRTQSYHFWACLRETQLYVRCLERGLTIFDLSATQAAADLVQWTPILDWMDPLLNPVQAANDPTPTARSSSILPPTRSHWARRDWAHHAQPV
jgi:chromosome partitioning protein